MGGPLLGGVGPRGGRRRPELRPHVRDPHAEGEDRPAGRPRPGRPQPARGPPTPQLAYSDETIARVTAHDERIQRLRTVPSVGPVTAAAFVATLDDAHRLRHAHEVEAYLGLVPRELSSGETQHRGHITKAGPTRMRWLLVQVAVSILRRRPPQAEALHAWALHIAARRGKHVAVVALARRLAGILYALLRAGSVFAPERSRHPGAALALPA